MPTESNKVELKALIAPDLKEALEFLASRRDVEVDDLIDEALSAYVYRKAGGYLEEIKKMTTAAIKEAKTNSKHKHSPTSPPSRL